MKRTVKSSSYLLRIEPGEKHHLEALARSKGLTLAEALRRGARDYLEAEDPSEGRRKALTGVSG